MYACSMRWNLLEESHYNKNLITSILPEEFCLKNLIQKIYLYIKLFLKVITS